MTYPRVQASDAQKDSRGNSGDDNEERLKKMANADEALYEQPWYWSGREDLNLRHPAPKAGALPGCATPRLLDVHSLRPPAERSVSALRGGAGGKMTFLNIQYYVRSVCSLFCNNSRTCAKAFARWLMRFFSSLESSAKVLPNSGT